MSFNSLKLMTLSAKGC